MTHNGEKIMNRNRPRNDTELVNTNIKTYSYVKEAREQTEYVNCRPRRCIKIKIELPEIRSTMSVINSRNKG